MAINGKMVRAHHHQHPISQINTPLTFGKRLSGQSAELGVKRVKFERIYGFQQAA
ncbi:hypothetical protein JHZ65_06285 [Pseudomonas syringae pv. maculicola]|uniref:hypothetical protein n=1 Tax=Pseudomonas syringae group genomosp. 3 TaxID=251701 RepID=UPI0016054C80|nr:hypothetical protein [Pseudomonas syringae group genomosp. 3]QQN28590.1 hypothetical protein JHZ65_06285 [Pseudomonas syringae pv. maculicola]